MSLTRASLLFSLAISLAFLAPFPGSSAQTLPERQTITSQSLVAAFATDGSYSLRIISSGWSLEGALAAPVHQIFTSAGKDQIGSYQSLLAKYQGGKRTAEIRIYDSLPIALFNDSWNSRGSNVAPFPDFRRMPAGLLRFSYQKQAFGTYEFGAIGPQGPSALFDKRGDVLLLSPTDHFLVSQMEALPGGGFDSRIIGAVHELPSGFTHGTILVAGKGINETFAAWGNALLALSGKQRSSNDSGVLLSHLGYWTDHGSHYYYKFDKHLGYPGTLLAVRDDFERLGIPLGYMQLDSWWYPKGPRSRWDSRGKSIPFGESVYRADKNLFPDGLAAFQQSLGLPLVIHARWISPSSPYRSQFKMSDNVIVDPAYWKETAAYLRESGVVAFEQDWLNHNALPPLNLVAPDAFLGGMSEAMQSSTIDIMYCMPLPAHYLASTLYPNVSMIRVSGDRFALRNWDAFLYDSRLAASVGLWPWTDVFSSGELDNLIISTLSGGPVGIGDPIGEINAPNLMTSMRKDGLLIKPDTPLLPIDAMYASDATHQKVPMIAEAETKFASSSVHYVFSYPRKRSQFDYSVSLSDLGISGPAYAYDWLAHTGKVIESGGTLPIHYKDGFSYTVLVPVNQEGLALLGDTEKIVPLGKQRVASIENNGSLAATIEFAPGESELNISGYASRRPKLSALSGELKHVTYDPKSGIFQVRLSPSPSGRALLKISAE